MRPSLSLLAATALVACAKSTPPAASGDALPDGAVAREFPENLAPSDFEMPPVSTGTLSNGLTVHVVENHETPLWFARVVLKVGTDADPVGKEGLASVTFDLMDDGAGELDGAGLAKALKLLGGSIGSGAGRDSASVAVSGPTRHIAPLLDLWADVLLRPSFPADEWELMQARRIADLKASLENPNAIAGRVAARTTWGDRYTGRLSSAASYEAMSRADLEAFHAAQVDPAQAVVFVGGDVTLDEVLPLLEERLGSWTGDATPTEPQATPQAFESERVYFVDKPGAAQTVLLASLPVLDRSQADYWDLYLGNTVLGGAFTARVNMNLREDKGWTYGARCYLDDTAGPSIWGCSTSVQTDKTVPAFLELRKEIADLVGDRPVTADEIAFFQSNRINDFKGSYETPGSLLGELRDIWTHDLPADWLEQYVPGVQGVTADTANAALARWIDPGRVHWIVVGDREAVFDGLAETGLEIVELSREGLPLETP